MMQKKRRGGIVLAGLGILMVGLVAGCGGQYADVVEVNRNFVAAMENFTLAMERVDSADSAAAALNDLADELEVLAPKMKALNEKFPELRNPEELPEPLQSVQDETEAAGREYAKSMMKMIPYMSDPAVQKAQTRVAQAMTGMGGR